MRPTFAQEGARVLDVRHVVRVAQAAGAAVLLRWVAAARLDGLRALTPVGGERLRRAAVGAAGAGARRRRCGNAVAAADGQGAAGAAVAVGWPRKTSRGPGCGNGGRAGTRDSGGTTRDERKAMERLKRGVWVKRGGWVRQFGVRRALGRGGPGRGARVRPCTKLRRLE